MLATPAETLRTATVTAGAVHFILVLGDQVLDGIPGCDLTPVHSLHVTQAYTHQYINIHKEKFFFGLVDKLP